MQAFFLWETVKQRPSENKGFDEAETASLFAVSRTVTALIFRRPSTLQLLL
ncbi:MAG: hypothetical protein Q4D82_05905 [Neisseria sp.]|nr:hypothetical protein [Neisseria sp.]